MAAAALSETTIKLVVVSADRGDAIFICIDYKSGNKHCYLVDGSFGGRRPPTQSPSDLECTGETAGGGLIAPDDHTKLITTFEHITTTEGYQLKGIIVTHPDQDHYQGIIYLFQAIKSIQCPVLLTNRFLYKVCINSKQQRVGETFLSVLEQTHQGEHVCESSQLDGFPTFLKFHHKYTGLVIYRYNGKATNSKKTAKKPNLSNNIDVNETSIITTICNPDDESEVLVCLTSNAKIDEQHKADIDLSEYFSNKYPRVFQVPHQNSSQALYEAVASNGMICLISCGTHVDPDGDICTLSHIYEAAKQKLIKMKVVLTSGIHLEGNIPNVLENDPQFLSIYYWDKKVAANPFLEIGVFPTLSIGTDTVEWSIDGYKTLVDRCKTKKRGRFIVKTKPKDSGEVDYLHIINNQSLFLPNEIALEGIYNIPSPLSPWNWDNKVVLLTDTLTSIEGPALFLQTGDVDWGSTTDCPCTLSEYNVVPWQTNYTILYNEEQSDLLVNTEI